MNSQINLTAAKVRRLLLVTALAICPLVASQAVNAQDTATATLTSGGANSITITGNQQFTLSLAVTTNFAASGYTVFYQSNNGNGFFQLIGRTNTSPINPTTMMRVFNDPTTPDGVAFGGTAGVLNPTNDFDLGFTGDSFNNQPAGSYSLQMVTVQTLNAPPGTFTIFLDNRSILTSRTGGGFNDVNIGGPGGPQFTVNVIPEPTTVGLALVGGAALLVAAYRKKRAGV